MPILPLQLPQDTTELFAAHVHGEYASLIAASETHSSPAGLTITRYGIQQGAISQLEQVALGPHAMWWDAGFGGLWGIDGQGLLRLPSSARIAALSTPLAQLGPATPVRTQIATDLNSDGAAELVLWTSGQYQLWRPDGSPLGSIYAPAQAELRQDGEHGGLTQLATHKVPSLVVADANGDGLLDLLLPGQDAVKVHFSGPHSVDVREQSWTLPISFGPSADYQITDVHWVDASGDGKVDLLLHRIEQRGSVFGREGEFCLMVGTGSGLGAPSCVSTGAASWEIYPRDVDGDGDLDLVLPLVDTSFSGLARGLVARSMPIALVRFELDQGAYQATPTQLLAVEVSLEEPEITWSLDGDLNGDGLLDLVLVLEGELEIFPGTASGLAASPSYSHLFDHAVERLILSDLQGDGTPEIVLWAPGEQDASVLLLE